jgi:hypothetical protein
MQCIRSSFACDMKLLLVITFDAHVPKWNLDNKPPQEYTRHRVKQTSFYGEYSWSIDLVIKLPDEGASENSGILLNFIGLQEKGMWPGKKALLEAENLDIAAIL